MNSWYFKFLIIKKIEVNSCEFKQSFKVLTEMHHNNPKNSRIFFIQDEIKRIAMNSNTLRKICKLEFNSG